MSFFEENLVKRETIQLSQDWIEGTSYGISQVQVSGDQVNLVIYGSGERPALSALGDRLNDSLDRTIDLNLLVVPSAQERYKADRDD
jgi:hypothetical protein